MKPRAYCILAVLLAQPAFAQESVPVPSPANTPLVAGDHATGSDHLSSTWDTSNGSGRGFLTGDKAFPGFMGYVSNPTKSIDPRSLTQIMPIYGYASLDAIHHTTRGIGPLPPRDITILPAGEINVVGPALSIAITERLNIGLTNGGAAVTSYTGRHQGWLDIGAYAQYALIRDVPGQFLATAGLGWTAPSGSSSLFQGTPPWHLSPYVTAGKELGDWHVLTTFGFDFPAGSANPSTDTFYGSLHLDRRCFGWLYPLVEFNWEVSTTNVDFNSPFLRHAIGFDDFSANGSILTVAPGFNAVLIPDKVELGAVYETPITSQHHVHFNSFLVKLVLRY